MYLLIQSHDEANKKNKSNKIYRFLIFSKSNPLSEKLFNFYENNIYLLNNQQYQKIKHYNNLFEKVSKINKKDFFY